MEWCHYCMYHLLFISYCRFYFFSFFPALLKTQLHFDARSIGMTITTFATMSFALSVTSRLIQRWDVVSTCTLGLGMISLGLASLAMTSKDCGIFILSESTLIGQWIHHQWVSYSRECFTLGLFIVRVYP